MISHEQIEKALSTEPFAPFVLRVEDGRKVAVKRADQAVLNAQVISVVEAPFVMTVLGLHQIESIDY